MQEKIGFWIMFCASFVLLCSAFLGESTMQWIEKKMRIPWYIQIMTPAVGIIMTFIGWQIWAMGNQGRYPGYPLDVIIQWFQ